MRWASGRKATRIEDEVYSLLGLFRVNMPLLYGEGRRALLRLQLEIIKRSRDETILAWYSLGQQIRGGLTDDVRNFTMVYLHRHALIARKHFEHTNMGLRFSVPVSRLSLDQIVNKRQKRGYILDTKLLLPLNCTGRYRGMSTDSIHGKVALLLWIFATEAELDLKILNARRWNGGICILEDSSDGHLDDFPENSTGNSRGTCVGGKEEWINVATCKSAKFDLVIGTTRDESLEEYSLYIQTGRT